MYAETGGPNVKWGAPISNGGARHHCPSAGDGPRYQVGKRCSPNKGVRKGGLGLNPLLELDILRKLFYLRKED